MVIFTLYLFGLRCRDQDTTNPDPGAGPGPNVQGPDPGTGEGIGTKRTNLKEAIAGHHAGKPLSMLTTSTTVAQPVLFVFLCFARGARYILKPAIQSTLHASIPSFKDFYQKIFLNLSTKMNASTFCTRCSEARFDRNSMISY